MNGLLHRKRLRVLLCAAVLAGSTGAGTMPDLQSFTSVAEAAGTGDTQLFYDSFEYGSGTAVPALAPSRWSQDGANGSLVKTMTSGMHTGTYGAKLDAADALTLHLSTTGYSNIQLSYWYKSNVTAGGVKVEYSVDSGTHWIALDPIDASQGTFTQRTYMLTPPGYTAADHAADFQVRYRVDSAAALSGNIYIDDVEVRGTADSGTIPEPQGPDITFFNDNFDDPDNYGSDGGVVIPSPWVQEGANASAAKTSVSTSAPSLPNLVKIDALDALALPLNTTGYGNIKLSYYTRASSYISGSIVAEWSPDGGASWTTLEDFKLPPGTAEQKNSQSNTLKSWTLPSTANNNANVKIRFRVGDTMSANMYIDSVSIAGQAIPGIPPATSPVPVTPPVDPVPFTPPAGVTLYEDVQIGMAGSRPLYTSIAVPETAPASPMPVVVYIHGGGWNHGDRKQALGTICGYVAKRGYIGVSLDYRLTPEAPYPAQIQDVKLAITFASQLTAAGVPVVDFQVVPGQGHGFTGTASEQANAQAWTFLDQYVKNRTVTEQVYYKAGYQP